MEAHMKRTQYTPNEKAKIVIEILQGEQSIAELSSIYGINPNMLNRWKREALEGLPQVFERSSLYYQPVKPSIRDLEYKAAIDRIYTKSSFFGSRRIALALSEEYGYTINRKAVQRHMREMGIEAIYPRPKTSTPNPRHTVYPYLLKGMNIQRPNQVWAIDITYIPLATSWLYLTVIIDWYSRYVISWELNDSLHIGFVLEASKRALSIASHEIMNSDQGSHFTSPKFIEPFLNVGSKISMDHRGRAFDNIMIERLWRTIKYENVYLMQYESPKAARIGLKKYFEFYNTERYHQSLGYQKPADVYFQI